MHTAAGTSWPSVLAVNVMGYLAFEGFRPLLPAR
jgi:hypothetical protein